MDRHSDSSRNLLDMEFFKNLLQMTTNRGLGRSTTVPRVPLVDPQSVYVSNQGTKYRQEISSSGALGKEFAPVGPPHGEVFELHSEGDDLVLGKVLGVWASKGKLIHHIARERGNYAELA
ncbi:hypothetical protein PHISCL_06495 [Aspergillus sclerotialis]|uniref:Uncharacterized protein n=1 Tax=Aspergillus sclerotialis TaxID=2070753 RepID=A0A3A2ZDF3_9EURO|nr:hypothetical protein PHISCL_06495 [Aspergillus sclerotialis]